MLTLLLGCEDGVLSLQGYFLSLSQMCQMKLLQGFLSYAVIYPQIYILPPSIVEIILSLEKLGF